MPKKSFSGGLNSLLGESSPVKKEEAKTAKKEITKTSKIGTKEKETRATFIVQEDLLEKMKAIAYWKRSLIKDIVNEAFQDYISSHEKYDKVKSIPEK